MFLSLIITLCDLRHIYHSECSSPRQADDRRATPTLLPRSYPNHRRVIQATSPRYPPASQYGPARCPSP